MGDILIKKNQILQGERIYLKILKEENASEEYCSWLNDTEVNKYLETRKITIEQLQNYIKERISNPTNFFWGIFLKETNQHIGNIKLEPIDYKKKISNFGILIGNKSLWGKGYGTEATRLVINFAFKELGLQKVELGVISENHAAIKLHEKVGFKLEKIEHKSINHTGLLYDCHKMVIKINEGIKK